MSEPVLDLPLTPSGLIRNRAGAAPQSIRSEERLDLSIRPIEGYADSVGKVGFPMFPEDSLKRLELLSQGFNAHGVSPAFLPISCDASSPGLAMVAEQRMNWGLTP